MRFSLKHLNPNSAAATRRHLCADVQHSEPPMESPSLVSRTVSLLQSKDPKSWSSDPCIGNLLFYLPPSDILSLTCQLKSFENALNFFNCLKANSPLPDAQSLAFHAVLELAIRENPDSPGKLHDLFLLAKGKKVVPVYINSVTLIIKCFGTAKMLNEMVRVFGGIDEKMKNSNVLNLAISGFLERGRIHDAQKLLDEMLQPNSAYPPNNNTIGIVLSCALKQKWRGMSFTDDDLYALITRFTEHGVSPDGFLLTQIITRFCRNSLYDKAWDILHSAMKSQSNLRVASCNALLTGLGKGRDFKRMNALVKEMQDCGIKPDVITYGILIKHLCKFHRVDDALDLAEKMRSTGIIADVIIYNTLIDGLCKVGRQEGGLELMERMKSESECEPNTVTYNCLIDGFCKAGDIQKGEKLFEQMNKQGIEKNVITLNTLLDGMCKHGRVNSAMALFNSMKEEEKGLLFKANAVTYSILITAFCSVNNIDKSLSLFNEMLENGCSPDAVVYYSLISGLSRAGRMNDASLMASKLKQAGFGLDLLCFNTLIGGFCRTKKLDKALDMLKDMEKARVKPDLVTYNTLLTHFCGKGDFSSAHELIKKMKDDNVKGDIITYGTLIRGYCSNNELESAMMIFKEMRMPPNCVIYNILIDAHCKKDDVETGIGLMKDMRERGVRPNVTTYNAVFKGLQKRNWYEKAVEFMDEMSETGCNPDYVTMEILTEWVSAAGEAEKLRQFVEGFREVKISKT